MGKFGWSYPPGVTNRDIDEQAGLFATCPMCGEPVDNCICPECPKCQVIGDPECYSIHGLVESFEQKWHRDYWDAMQENDDRNVAQFDREYEAWQEHCEQVYNRDKGSS